MKTTILTLRVCFLMVFSAQSQNLSYVKKLGGSGTDAFVYQMTNSGDFVWAKRLGGTSFDYGYSIALNGSGSIYSTGSFNQQADFDPGTATFNLSSFGGSDIFVHKLSADASLPL